MQYGPYAVDYEYRPYNPERMRNERIAKAQASLKKHGLGAVMIFDYDYQRYLGYYSSHQYNRRRLGHFALLIEGEGFPYVPKDHFGGTWDESRMPWFKGKSILETATTFAIQQALPEHPDYVPRQMDKMVAEVKGLMQKHGKADMPVGIDLSNYHLIRAFDRAGVKVCDGLLAMTDAMQVKTEDEIHCLRMAGVITESAHWEVCKALRPGMTEFQIAGIAANALYKLGAEELEGPSFVVCSGERSGHVVPSMPTDRIVRPGDFVVIDINGVSFQGYRTCFYRTYLVGDKPTQFQKDVYKVCSRWPVCLDGVREARHHYRGHNKRMAEEGGLPGRMGTHTQVARAGKTLRRLGYAFDRSPFRRWGTRRLPGSLRIRAI